MRKFTSVLSALVLALVTLNGVSVASASPSAPGTAVTYTEVIDGGVLTYGWRPFTATEQSLLSASGSDVVIQPASASGCSQNVCIKITGSSNHVDSWETTAYNFGGYLCTSSKWWLNSSIIRSGNGVCGGAGVFFSVWNANQYFPSPSLACNTWVSIAGKPCETIRK